MSSNLRKLNERFRVCADTNLCHSPKARVPTECLLTQPFPDCFSRPRASRSSSRGRGVGLVFLLCAPSFSSLFFRFSVLVSRVLSRSRRCAVATPAIRGVSRVLVPHLLVAVRFLPTSRGQWHQEHMAPTQEPSIFSGIPSVRSPLVRCYLWLYLLVFWVFGSSSRNFGYLRS